MESPKPFDPTVIEAAAASVQKSFEEQRVLDSKIESYKNTLAKIIHSLISKKMPDLGSFESTVNVMKSMASDVIVIYNHYGLDYLDQLTNQYDDVAFKQYESLPSMYGSVPGSFLFVDSETLGEQGHMQIRQGFYYLSNIFIPRIVRLLPYAPRQGISCEHNSILSHNMSVDLTREIIERHAPNEANDFMTALKYNPYLAIKQPSSGTFASDPEILERLNTNITSQLADINRELHACDIAFTASHVKPKNYEDIRDAVQMQLVERSKASHFSKHAIATDNDMPLEKYMDVAQIHTSDMTARGTMSPIREGLNPIKCPSRKCAMLVVRNDIDNTPQCYITYCPYVVVSLTGASSNYLAIEEIRVNRDRANQLRHGENVLLLALLRAANTIKEIDYAVVDILTRTNRRGRWYRKRENSPTSTKIPQATRVLPTKLSKMFGMHYTFADMYMAKFTASGSAGIPKHSAMLTYNYIVSLHSGSTDRALSEYAAQLSQCKIARVIEADEEEVEEIMPDEVEIAQQL